MGSQPDAGPRDVGAALADLGARVLRLEEAAGAVPAGGDGQEDALAAAVRRRVEERPPTERDAPAGRLRVAGHVRVAGEREVWTAEHDLEDLLALPSAALARGLTGLAHPARIDIWRALLAGPRDSRALVAAAGLNTSGQLYHHLREMESAGLVERRGRNLWARRAIPAVAAALAAAAALHAGE